MKVIPLSILLIFCVIEVVNSSVISTENEKLIDGLKTTTQLAIKELKRFEEKLQSDFKIKINQTKVDSLNRMDGIIYYVLHGIETAVSAVNVTGIDAELCHKIANDSLKKLNETTYQHLDKCVPISLLPAEPLFKNITKATKVASKLLNDLDNTVATCSSDKTSIVEKCVIKKIQEYEITIKKLQTNVFKLKNDGFSVTKNVKTSVRSCQSKIVYNMRVEATFKIYRDANLCIRSYYKTGLYKVLL